MGGMSNRLVSPLWPIALMLALSSAGGTTTTTTADGCTHQYGRDKKKEERYERKRGEKGRYREIEEKKR